MIAFLNDLQIEDRCDWSGLMQAIAEAFRNGAAPPPRTHCDLPGDDGAKLLVMPAWQARDAIGVKVVTVAPGNRARGRPTINGVYVLLDGESGDPVAVMSAPALTALRTAAVCSLAADRLARSDATVLAMLGTGALARHLVEAHRSVRALERVLIWGRNPERAAMLVADLQRTGVPAVSAEDPDVAVAQSDIVCAATHATAPLVTGRDVRPGTHVTLVGSFTPEMREADLDLLAKARVFVDVRAALEESGDLIPAVQAGLVSPSAPDLSRLVAGEGRVSREEVTVFKTVGTGLADLAVARFLLGQGQRPPGAED